MSYKYSQFAILYQVATLRTSLNSALVYSGSFSGTEEELVSVLKKKQLSIVPTTTGKISLVSYQKNSTDWNRTGTNFYFHQDGSHLQDKPEFVALLCKHKGSGKTKTSLCDATKIYRNLINIVGKNFIHALTAVYINSDKKIFRRPFAEKLSGGKWYVNTFHYLEPNLSLLSENDRRVCNLKISTCITMFQKLQKKYTFYTHAWEDNDLLIFRNRENHHSRHTTDTKIDTERFLYRMWFTKT